MRRIFLKIAFKNFPTLTDHVSTNFWVEELNLELLNSLFHSLLEFKKKIKKIFRLFSPCSRFSRISSCISNKSIILTVGRAKLCISFSLFILCFTFESFLHCEKVEGFHIGIFLPNIVLIVASEKFCTD